MTPSVCPRMCQGLCHDPQNPTGLCCVPWDVSQILCPLGCSPLPSQPVSPGSSHSGGEHKGCCLTGVAGCRQGGDFPHSSTAQREMAHPASRTHQGVSQRPGRARSLPKPHVLLAEEHGQPQRAADTCGHFGTSLQEPHLPCILSDHAGSAPVVGTLCDSVTVTPQPVPASASLLWLSKARAVWPLIMSKPPWA